MNHACLVPLLHISVEKCCIIIAGIIAQGAVGFLGEVTGSDGIQN